MKFCTKQADIPRSSIVAYCHFNFFNNLLKVKAVCMTSLPKSLRMCTLITSLYVLLFLHLQLPIPFYHPLYITLYMLVISMASISGENEATHSMVLSLKVILISNSFKLLYLSSCPQKKNVKRVRSGPWGPVEPVLWVLPCQSFYCHHECPARF